MKGGEKDNRCGADGISIRRFQGLGVRVMAMSGDALLIAYANVTSSRLRELMNGEHGRIVNAPDIRKRSARPA
jgi:streptomycin 6-kinase